MSNSSILLLMKYTQRCVPTQSDGEKNTSFSGLEGLVMDSKSASEGNDLENEDVAHVEEFNEALKDLLQKTFVSLGFQFHHHKWTAMK